MKEVFQDIFCCVLRFIKIIIDDDCIELVFIRHFFRSFRDSGFDGFRIVGGARNQSSLQLFNGRRHDENREGFLLSATKAGMVALTDIASSLKLDASINRVCQHSGTVDCPRCLTRAISAAVLGTPCGPSCLVGMVPTYATTLLSRQIRRLML